MNEEAEKALLEKIERLEALITHTVKKKQSSFEWILSKLREQGTQRGVLMLIGSSFPLMGLGLAVEDTLTIMSAIFAIVGVNNIVTKG
jgi:hypothetical protein